MKHFNNLLRGIAVRMLLMVCAASALSGCSDDQLFTATGTVVDTGSFSSGGCEWAIELPAGYYEPHNLPLEFQTHGLAVEVTYSIVQSTANCPNAPTAHNFRALIHLHKIKQI